MNTHNEVKIRLHYHKGDETISWTDISNDVTGNAAPRIISKIKSWVGIKEKPKLLKGGTLYLSTQIFILNNDELRAKLIKRKYLDIELAVYDWMRNNYNKDTYHLCVVDTKEYDTIKSLCSNYSDTIILRDCYMASAAFTYNVIKNDVIIKKNILICVKDLFKLLGESSDLKHLTCRVIG